MTKILCPHCKEKLERVASSMKCPNGHTYDVSKHNYINFLSYGKLHGDNKEMIVARKNFLDLGFYAPLKDAISNQIKKLGTINSYLDAGCGEGFYTQGVIPHTSGNNVWAIDISKDAVIYANKRLKNINLAIASVYDMPFFEDSTFDLITSIFSPFAENEFKRVLKNGGYLISVIPGKYHLFDIKKIVYPKPYENEVKPFEISGFEFISETPVNYDITLSTDQALTLWKMTPYYYRSPKQGIEALSNISEIKTQVSFHILIFKLNKDR